MSIPTNKNNNNNNNNSHHKHHSKLPELKIKIKNEFNEYSPIRRNRHQANFNSPDESHLKNNNSILKKNTFNPNISNLKTNNELIVSTDRELDTNIRKTKSILKKNSINNDEIERDHEHEHKTVHFAFDENNQPLKTVFVIENNDKVYIHKNGKNGKDINEGNIKNNEICKCESCIIF